MPKLSDHHNHTTPPEILERALLLACERIADSAQSYEEANTPEGWCEEFIHRAEAEQRPEAVKM